MPTKMKEKFNQKKDENFLDQIAKKKTQTAKAGMECRKICKMAKAKNKSRNKSATSSAGRTKNQKKKHFITETE